MKKIAYMMSTILFISLTVILFGQSVYVLAVEDDRICKGVFIDEVEVSDMTKQEAEEAVENFVEMLRGKTVAILVDDNIIHTTLGELGYNYVPNNYIDQALTLGKNGNLIKRYKDLKDIEKGNIVYTIDFTIDDNKIAEFVDKEVGAYNIAPINATVTRVNKEFRYTDHKVGRKVDVAQTSDLIRNAILNEWNRNNIVLNAMLIDDMPQYTRDIVEKCNTIIGTFTTEFKSSAEGRAANLANGARLINNAVLYPGEVFSSYKYLTPFTVANGYFEAGAYSQGMVVDSIGGGACQVTTTLYNAVLYAELEVVERAAHSMTIGYVDLSRDAAIAGTYKDFKFRNSSDVPIVIEAYTVDRKITFNIWGHEARDTRNRRIEYVTVVLAETPPPPDVVTQDPTRPTSYRKVTQAAHWGFRAELYKVVYENNVEVSRQLVNKSNYAATPRYVTVGTKRETPQRQVTPPVEEIAPSANQMLDEAPTGDVWNGE